MSFMALANEHNMHNTMNQNKLSVEQNTKMHIPNKLNHNFDLDNVPFYNTTLKRGSDPFMNTLKTRTESKFGDDMKTTVKPNLFEPKLSPRVKINTTNYDPTSQMKTGAWMPFQKEVSMQGILKNTMQWKNVSWFDKPVQNTETGQTCSFPPKLEVPKSGPEQLTDSNTYISSYNPAVIPNSKKVYRFGSNWFMLENSADPSIVEQLGGLPVSLDSMKDSLNHHELRAYDYWNVDYDPIITNQFKKAQEYENTLSPRENKIFETFEPKRQSDGNLMSDRTDLSRDPNFVYSSKSKATSGDLSKSGKIVSASPFRAYRAFNN